MNNTDIEQCVFCSIARRQLAPEVIAFHDEQTAVFPSLHQQPRNRGHMLVVPIRHVAQIYDVDAGLAGPLMMTEIIRDASKTSCRPSRDAD